MRLERQQVVVIGGSSGIGEGVAAACLAEGAEVTIAGRSAPRLAAAAARLGRGTTTAVADATRDDDVRALFDRGPVHHIVVTAVSPCYAPVRTLDLALAQAA